MEVTKVLNLMTTQHKLQILAILLSASFEDPAVFPSASSVPLHSPQKSMRTIIIPH